LRGKGWERREKERERRDGRDVKGMEGKEEREGARERRTLSPPFRFCGYAHVIH